MLTIGLDIATHLGLGAVEDGKVVASHMIFEKPLGKNVPQEDRFKRWHQYADKTVSWVNSLRPDLVVIEGYGYANANSLATLVEVGTVVRSALHKQGLPFIEVPPAALKKYVTGTGNAPKQVMIMEVYKRFGFETHDDDVADAVALAFMGQALAGYPTPVPAAHLKALAELKAAKHPFCNQFQPLDKPITPG